jgi:hypothetical protein
MGKDFEGGGCCLVEVLFRCLRASSEEKREESQCVGFEVLTAVVPGIYEGADKTLAL